MFNKSEQIISLKSYIANKEVNTKESHEDFLNLKFSLYNINLINAELNEIVSSDMFSSNSAKIQLDKENKTPDDVTIFNESVLANLNITCDTGDQ